MQHISICYFFYSDICSKKAAGSQRWAGKNCPHSFQNHLNPFCHLYITFACFFILNIYISALFIIFCPDRWKSPLSALSTIFKSFRDISADHLPFKCKLQNDYGRCFPLNSNLLFVYWLFEHHHNLLQRL